MATSQWRKAKEALKVAEQTAIKLRSLWRCVISAVHKGTDKHPEAARRSQRDLLCAPIFEPPVD
ncbi:hypothetical protein HRbin17_01303 [bacterium HR17]|uniref:Uncharacterized protein n=1 Tax=Candidatus Fervidibacter japonicus TaxID=2035412 RepID=A0A2H5XC77_9BACT|nr:hypothetical protein HRbin17_01303 [bacterium HR17]